MCAFGLEEKSNKDKLIITPDTKVGAVLDAYPELEGVLIAIAPDFARLRNPVLRKTVAKVASLRHVAVIGKIPLNDMINQLREKVGQNRYEEGLNSSPVKSDDVPEWITSGNVVETLDARPILEQGGHPVDRVMRDLAGLEAGQLYELITPFIPSPLIDMAKTKGFKAWTKEESSDLFRTYFGRGIVYDNK